MMTGNINYFGTIAISIVLEALPFLLLGSLISSCIEVYVPQKVFDRFIPKGKIARVFSGLLIGLIIPSEGRKAEPKEAESRRLRCR